jgi:putative sterol carrier protein
MAKFLSDDWAKDMERLLNESEQFIAAAGDIDLVMQQHVEGGPDGDVSYFLQIRDGKATIDIGASDGAHVTATQDYETAAAIAKGELSMQNAFMSGKLKVSGDLGKVMQHQAALASLETLREQLRVEFD